MKRVVTDSQMECLAEAIHMQGRRLVDEIERLRAALAEIARPEMQNTESMRIIALLALGPNVEANRPKTAQEEL